jgi:uncharacterized protein DUF6457
MDAWMDRLADALGEDRVSQGEMGMALKMAREVAHGVERKLAPLSTFVAGVHAGRAAASGGSREEGLKGAMEAVLDLLPERVEDENRDPSH